MTPQEIGDAAVTRNLISLGFVRQSDGSWWSPAQVLNERARKLAEDVPGGGLAHGVTHGGDYFPPLAPRNDVTGLLGSAVTLPPPTPPPPAPVVTVTVGGAVTTIPVRADVAEVLDPEPLIVNSALPYAQSEYQSGESNLLNNYGTIESSISQTHGGGQGGKSGWEWQQKDGPEKTCRKKAPRKKVKKTR